MKTREIILLVVALIVAVSLFFGSQGVYEKLLVRFAIALFFTIVILLRARVVWARWLAIAIIWIGLLLTLIK